MGIPETAIDELRVQGFAIVPGFLDPDEVEAAREGLWLHYPRPEDFFADPARFPHLTADQFGGLHGGYPYRCWDLSRLAFHPDLVDAAERFLGSSDLRLYKIDLWAKYAGATSYAQPHHRDFGNHSLVVPRRDGIGVQLNSFILLSDVSIDDAPTRVVPLTESIDVPFVVKNRRNSVSVLRWGEKFDVEVPVVGPAGTIMLYRTDVLHRASEFGGRRRSRFTLLADYEVRGSTWTGHSTWPLNAMTDDWVETASRMTVRERDLFGFPRPGDRYWNEQTLRDVAARYPKMDLSQYRNSAAVETDGGGSGAAVETDGDTFQPGGGGREPVEHGGIVARHHQ